MSLNLDTRQRALLAEMGVRVWWPMAVEPDAASQAEPAELPAAPQRQPVVLTPPTLAPTPSPLSPSPTSGSGSGQSPAAPPSLSATAKKPPIPAGPTPTTLLPLPPDIQSMDWPALSAAVASCQACTLCLGRRAPVLAAPAQALQADWLVLGEPPDDAQERAGAPLVEAPGLLLDNMLQAVGVRRYQPGASVDPASTAYLSLYPKCRPALPTAPDARALAACAHYVRREIALVQPKVILAMGRAAMQLLLSEDQPQGLKLPLGKLRGQVWHFQGVPVVVTYPPSYLLRNGQDKARAWEDLCLALQVAQGRATAS